MKTAELKVIKTNYIGKHKTGSYWPGYSGSIGKGYKGSKEKRNKEKKLPSVVSKLKSMKRGLSHVFRKTPSKESK